MKKTGITSVCAALLFAFACSSESGSNGGSSGNAGSGANGGTGATGQGGSGGSGCVLPKTSTTDGSSACEPMCLAGEHCAPSGVTCSNGCRTEANCSAGQACDMSAGTKDMWGQATGVCRVPTPCPVGTGGTTGVGGSGGQQGFSCLLGAGNQPTAACSAYVKCQMQVCDVQLKAAFGNNYANGDIGGVCKDFMTCATNGGCTDSAVMNCVSSATPTCQAAMQTVGNCTQSACPAEETACNNSVGPGGSSGAGGFAGGATTGSCADLKICCATGTFPDPGQQQGCTMQAESGMDAACASALQSFKGLGFCK